MPGPVGTGMGGRVRGSTPGVGNFYITSHPDQLSLAIPPCMDRRNECQPKGGDALRLGTKGSS